VPCTRFLASFFRRKLSPRPRYGRPTGRVRKKTIPSTFVGISAVRANFWRQQSKGARSFRGQNILEPGHPDALFSQKKLTTFFSRRLQNTKAANAPEIVSLSKIKIKQIKRSAVRYGEIFIFCSHYYRSKAKQSNRQGGARAVARPGVAPPLLEICLKMTNLYRLNHENPHFASRRICCKRTVLGSLIRMSCPQTLQI